MAKTQRRVKSGSPAPKTPPMGRWSTRLPEAVLLCLVVAVPLGLNIRSHNVMDVKEVTLGLGVFVGLALWLVASLAEGRIAWASSRLNVLVVAFLAWAAITLTYSRFWWVSVSDYGRLASNVGIFLLTIIAVRSLAQVRRLAFAISVAAMLTCIYAFLQQRGYEPLGVEWTGAQLIQGRAAISFAANVTYLAGYLILVLPLIVAVGWPEGEASAGAGERRRGAILGLVLLTAGVTVGFDRVFTGEVGGLVAYLAALLALVLAAVWWPVKSANVRADERPAQKGPIIFYGVTAVIMALTLFYSITFSAVGGLALGVVAAGGLMVVRGKGRVLLRLLVAALAAAIVFSLLGVLAYARLPRNQRVRVQRIMQLKDPSASERQIQWRGAWEMFKQHPAFGAGYSVYRVAATEQLSAAWYGQRGKRVQTGFAANHAHNEFLQVFAETGAIGGAIFLALLLGMLATAARVALRHPEPGWRRVGLAAIVGSIAFLFQNLFGVTFRVTGAPMFFWLLLGLVVVAAGGLPRADGRRGEGVRGKSFRRLPAPAVVVVGLVLALGTWGLGAVVLRPVMANHLIRIVQLNVDRGEWQRAIGVGKLTLEYCPYSSTTHYLLAYCYGQLGRYPEAVAESEAALAVLPGNASAYYNLGISYKQWGKLAEAAAALQKAVDLMPVPDNYVGLAETRLLQGDYATAESLTRQAIAGQERLAPDRPRMAGLYLLLADACARGGREAEAVAALEEAERYRPGDPRVGSMRVSVLLKLGRKAEAKEAVEAWVRADPKSAVALNVLASVQDELGDAEGAKASLLRAYELDPTNAEVRRNLAGCFAAAGAAEARKGNYEAAKQNLQRAREFDPDNARLQHDLAVCYAKTGEAKLVAGNLGGAKADLERALELGYDVPELHLDLGLCYHDLGDLVRTREQLEITVRTGGNSRAAQKAREGLSKLPK